MAATGEPASLAFGAGVDREALGAVLAEIGLGGIPLVPADSPDAASVVLLDGRTAARLGHGFDSRYRAFVEFSGTSGGLPERLLAPAGPGSFRLNISTATAYEVESAKLVCETLCRRGALPEAMRFPVEIALHEVIANAILHGNLGIESTAKEFPDQYDAFCAAVRARLAEPGRSRRWIDISADWNATRLRIAVGDEGGGYVPDAAVPSADHGGSHGRGLGIVWAIASEVTVCDDGRRTVMRFDYEA